MALKNRPRSDIVLLPIRKEFVTKIYSGEKRYELRKPGVPETTRYVVVAEGDDRLITGGWIVGKIFRLDREKLWERFGRLVSPRERFEEYFKNHPEGLAVEIRRTERLTEPIPISELTRRDPNFVVAPQFHFLYLTPPLLEYLGSRLTTLSEVLSESARERLDAWIEPEFRELRDSEAPEFSQMAMDYIGMWYDEIDKSFVDRILESHEQRRDRYGYFTLKKRVYTLLHEGEVAGYTVVTWKRGGSAKFGPTLLKPDFQGKGLGPRFRMALDEFLKSGGARKSYSTIPDAHSAAIRYLLKSKHTVEAHLRRHYTSKHNDLVFGRILDRPGVKATKGPTRRSSGTRLSVSDNIERYENFRDFILETMPAWYDGIDESFAESVYSAQGRYSPTDLSKKGKKVFLGNEGDEIFVTLICSIKRGGAVKLSPLLTKVDAKSSEVVLEAAESHFLSLPRVRKLYSLVPSLDSDLVGLFTGKGYQAEGLLREPYKPGVDMVVYALMKQEASRRSSS